MPGEESRRGIKDVQLPAGFNVTNVMCKFGWHWHTIQIYFTGLHTTKSVVQWEHFPACSQSKQINVNKNIEL